MKRSLLFLLPALLALASCGTASQYASSQQYPDGIYYRPEPSVKLLTEEDFKRRAAERLAAGETVDDKDLLAVFVDAFLQLSGFGATRIPLRTTITRTAITGRTAPATGVLPGITAGGIPVGTIHGMIRTGAGAFPGITTIIIAIITTIRTTTTTTITGLRLPSAAAVRIPAAMPPAATITAVPAA